MTCRLSGAKPLPEPMLAYGQLDTWEHISMNQHSIILSQENAFENVAWKMAVILSRPNCINCDAPMLRVMQGNG